MINVPRINQHQRYGKDGDHYCTVAVTEMYLWWANHKPPGVAIASEVYLDGGSGEHIARAVDDHTERPAESWFTPTGTRSQILHTLASGFPVPLGVDYLDAIVSGRGTVSAAGVELDKPHPRGVDRPYTTSAKKSGHWVIIKGYDEENLFINDPDTGTTITMSHAGERNGLFNSARRDGSLYLVLSKAVSKAARAGKALGKAVAKAR